MEFPPPLDTLSKDENSILEHYVEVLTYPVGSCIFAEHDPGDGCYIIDQGRVRIELGSDTHADDENILGFMEPGNILGELSLLDRLPRSASAFADTDVVVRRIGLQAIDNLVASQPHIGLLILSTLGRNASLKLRHATEQLDQYIHSKPDPLVDDMIERAVVAQKQIQDWSEERIDALLVAMAATIEAHAEELAIATVAETKIGNVADKTIKNRYASVTVCQSLTGHQGYGQLTLDKQRQVAEIANPIGVVFGLVPMTNPTSTFTFKALICIKSRNAVILSPSKQASGVSTQVGELLQEALRQHGAPVDLIQWVKVGNSRKTASLFMKHKKIALILATGGPSMVKAAYSSGNPAIGVGAGNAPALICADADLQLAAENVILSKSFDNGLICASENNLVVNSTIRANFVSELEKHGAAVLSTEESAALVREVVDAVKNKLKPEVVGQAAEKLASAANIHRNYPIRLLVVPQERVSPDSPFSFEKLAPLISLFTAADDNEGIELCQNLLAIDGTGHTAIIYTQNEGLIRRFGNEIPASRILVNAPGVQGALGLVSGLVPSLTLGCGTFGHNSTTDNVTYTHLLNIKRLAYYTPDMLRTSPS